MRLLLALPFLALPAAAAEPPSLAFPLGCRVGETCWVVGHMDHGAGTKAFDYACGPRTRDGQVATEIAVRDMVAVAQGVPVLAMADGKVVSVRDGMADAAYLRDKDAVKDRSCGNGVVIDHGEGWQTQYCHLRRDSITVAEGQRVEPRQPIGLAGMSGKTDIPKLAVELRVGRQPVDPFLGMGGMTACGPGPGQMWSGEAAKAAAYRPADIGFAAFSDVAPTETTVIFGAAEKPSLAADAPAIVLWTRLFGVLPGDELTLRISGPDGKPFAQDVAVVPVERQAYTRYAGQQRKIDRWPAGSYLGEIILRRVAPGGRVYEWKRTASVTVQ